MRRVLAFLRAVDPWAIAQDRRNRATLASINAVSAERDVQTERDIASWNEAVNAACQRVGSAFFSPIWGCA